MGSTRLPGKVLHRIKNKPMLLFLIERLKFVKNLDLIVVATTNKKIDDSICKLADDAGVEYFRGSEDDVLGRVTKASDRFEAKITIQLTADNPIIDPMIITDYLKKFKEYNPDFLTNSFIKSYPNGMDVSIFKTSFLRFIEKNATEKSFREHVPLYVKKNINSHNIIQIKAPKKLNRPELSVTVDEKKDFILVEKIIESLYDKKKDFGCIDIINYLDKNNRG